MHLWTSILLSFITWPIFIILGLVIYLLGLILVPIALACEAYSIRYSIFGYFKTLYTWRIMKLYSNLEDGDLGPDYYKPQKSAFVRGFMWFCRNPAAGLRWLPYLSVLINSKKVQYVGNLGSVDPSQYEIKQPSFVYIWQGAYSCFWWHFRVPFTNRLGRIMMGHKLYAADCKPQDYGYRRFGTGFAMQAKVVQLGNNRN